MHDGPPGNWKRTFLNVIIAAHLAALFLWGLPPNKFAVSMLAPVRHYFMQTGLWHTWNMFGGNVCVIQEDLRATVQYADGSTLLWTAPRMHELSLWKRISKERFRKWRELNFHEEFAASWPASARFVARQMNQSETNPPVKVSLTRYWQPTPEPKRQDYQPPLHPANVTFPFSYTYFATTIRDADL